MVASNPYCCFIKAIYILNQSEAAVPDPTGTCRQNMKKYVLTGILIIFCIVLIIYFTRTPEETSFRIIFRSAMDAPTGDPDFQTNPQKYFELYTINSDGSDIERITDNLYWESQPDVSPDGQKILCSIHYSAGRVKETDPGWEIAVMDIDGKNLKKLTNNDYLDFGAHWNHDGTKIVYVSDSAHRTAEDIENNILPQYDIYTMNADGSDKKQLTFAEPGEVNADPSFSFTEPDKILYIHSEGLSGNFDLYMMDADGKNKQLILEHTEELLAINDPMFSPDDKTIIFEAKIRQDQNDNPIYNIFTTNTSGENLTRITQDDGESDILPQYSPDGQKISYYTYVFENGGNTHRIRVANADGTEEKVISAYPWESDPSWIPEAVS